MSYLIVMNPVVRPNGINTIIGAKIRSSNSQVIHFNINSKIKNEMELRTVNKDQVMNRDIGGRDESKHARSVRADGIISF